MSDLYHDLGVDPSADPDAIKAAYRAAAKRHHPDNDGDRDEFEKVNRAWLVLQDPAKRARYDRTGEAESEPTNTLALVISMMNAAFDKALNEAHGVFEHVNIIALMLEDSRRNRAHLEAEIAKGKKALKRCDDMISRVEYRGGGQNLLDRIIKDRRGGLADQIRSMETSFEGFTILVTMLEDYGWRTDPQHPGWDQEEMFAEAARQLGTRGPGRFTNQTTQ